MLPIKFTHLGTYSGDATISYQSYYKICVKIFGKEIVWRSKESFNSYWAADRVAKAHVRLLNKQTADTFDLREKLGYYHA